MTEIITFNTDNLHEVQDLSVQEIQILDVIPEPNEMLKEIMPTFDFDNPPCDPVKLASQLVETVRYSKGAVGLAAPQCGLKHRVFVMGTGDNYIACFNPEITYSSSVTNSIIEGCLSFPLLALHVSRSNNIDVKYQNESGKWFEETLTDMIARIFQHETDHLNGIVFISHIKPMALDMAYKRRNKLKKLITKIKQKKKGI